MPNPLARLRCRRRRRHRPDKNLPALERRGFVRVPSNATVHYRPETRSKATRPYLAGVIKNASLGGLYIETRRPLRKGSIVGLRFILGHGRAARALRASARVRWSRRLFGTRGMGVEFIEFEGPGRRSLEECLQSLR
jgi:c-di-GMP-binding flagellar brake protein YcgR